MCHFVDRDFIFIFERFNKENNYVNSKNFYSYTIFNYELAGQSR